MFTFSNSIQSKIIIDCILSLFFWECYVWKWISPTNCDDSIKYKSFKDRSESFVSSSSHGAGYIYLKVTVLGNFDYFETHFVCCMFVYYDTLNSFNPILPRIIKLLQILNSLWRPKQQGLPKAGNLKQDIVTSPVWILSWGMTDYDIWMWPQINKSDCFKCVSFL